MEEEKKIYPYMHDIFVNKEVVSRVNTWDELEDALKEIKKEYESKNFKFEYSCDSGGRSIVLMVNIKEQNAVFISHKMNTMITDIYGEYYKH